MKKKELNKDVVAEYKYLNGSAAAVSVVGNTEALTVDNSHLATQSIDHKGKNIEFIKWGDSDELPVKVLNAVFSNVIVGPNIGTNAKTIYGSGVSVFLQTVKEGSDKIKYVEQLRSQQKDIFEFLEDNGCNRIVQEVANDMAVFGDACVEITLNADMSKVVRVRHLEMCYSRYSKIDDTEHRSLYHGYSTKWGKSPNKENVTVTPLLDRKAPIANLLEIMGKKMGSNKEKKADKSKGTRFVMSLSFPTPGRLYYNKPYWWSLFESGWYDFACAIPKFKKAILLNQMTIKYHVKISKTFFEQLYAKHGVAKGELDKQKEVADKFYKELDDYLVGVENNNKAFTSTFEYSLDGKEKFNILIEKIDSTNKGGEYIDDSEEVANIICFAMEVHPSLNGAAPGKNKSINGTEARELFIIKQEMQRPTRDMILTFMNAVKRANGWNEDIYFGIKNAQLTTLDKGTGSEKKIGNEEV